MFKSKVESKYQITAGFFSWLCPYCSFPILNTHYQANKAWHTAIQIEKHGKNEGFYDGYGTHPASAAYQLPAKSWQT